ncbi:hypothetical protein KJS94_05325 [Flavihumibacter rivuli]|uniref:hypothetical protein n=1 Tax=Flavihumibacter rivuli TaxID=2838156 RepID=UPI001BDDF925|nr:hypothetical protein [Flavihumibacter rivuli]ULQ57620.1 hypothetical protein KJS94_05325 [Flavihumibacter rivuli]
MGTILAVCTLEASKKRETCIVNLPVQPMMALRHIWAIHEGDTLMVPIKGNRILFELKPGKYDFWLDAVAPFKDQYIRDVYLQDHTQTSLERVTLSK